MYEEDIALEYTEDGTMGQTLERRIDKDSMPPLQRVIASEEVFAEHPPSYTGRWNVARSNFPCSNHISSHYGDY